MRGSSPGNKEIKKLYCLTFSAFSRLWQLRREVLPLVDDTDVADVRRLLAAADVFHLDRDDRRLVGVDQVSHRVDVSTRLRLTCLKRKIFFIYFPNRKLTFIFASLMARLGLFPTFQEVTGNYTHVSSVTPLVRDLNPGCFTD